MKKTRIYILLMALLLSFGCASTTKESKKPTGNKTGFLLCPPPLELYKESVSIRFDAGSRQDTASVKERISNRSNRNLMHWLSSSTLDSTP